MARTLYYTQRSPYARKVRIALIEKQLPCQLQETDIVNKSAKLLDLSPIGKVPVLVEPDGTVLWDSTLIFEYLDDTYPQPRFYPTQMRERLQCRLWEELADTLTDNVVALWLQKRKGDKADADDQAKYQSAIDRLLPTLDQQLALAPYLLGPTWTAVDVAAIAALGYYDLRFGQEWQHKYLRLAKWFARLHERESVQATVPKA